MPDSSSPPGDDDPGDLENLMILSPEQYELLLKAREEQGHDLSRAQIDEVLAAFEERSCRGRPSRVVEHYFEQWYRRIGAPTRSTDRGSA